MLLVCLGRAHDFPLDSGARVLISLKRLSLTCDSSALISLELSRNV